MAVTAGTFRADFPEFNNQSAYPTPAVNYYLALAAILLNAERWGGSSPAAATSPPTALIDFATELFVAHFITIEAKAQAAAAKGSPPGEVTGPTSAKSVGPISISFDSAAVVNEDAGHWNSTLYGVRFWQLADMAGAGPVQFGASACTAPFASWTAWLGPPNWPGWFQNT